MMWTIPNRTAHTSIFEGPSYYMDYTGRAAYDFGRFGPTPVQLATLAGYGGA